MTFFFKKGIQKYIYFQKSEGKEIKMEFCMETFGHDQ